MIKWEKIIRCMVKDSKTFAYLTYKRQEAVLEHPVMEGA